MVSSDNDVTVSLLKETIRVLLKQHEALQL